MNKDDYTKCAQGVWSEAQKVEYSLWEAEPPDGNDWNSWWASKFNNYQTLNEVKAETVLEIGCGPYAKNLDLVINSLKSYPSNLILNDPLLDKYVSSGKSVSRYLGKSTLISKPFELCDESEIPLKSVDVAICNNVLDHVYDVDLLLHNAYKCLKDGGYFIFGQDLKNPTDQGWDQFFPAHPIRVDHDYLDHLLADKYHQVLYKILPRDEGRNSAYHYGTYIFIGKKR